MKTLAQYDAEVASLKAVNARLNNEIHDLQARVVELESGKALEASVQEALDLENEVESLKAQLDETENDTALAEAVHVWFEKRGVNFATTDHETAQLLRVAGLERYYV